MRVSGRSDKIGTNCFPALRLVCAPGAVKFAVTHIREMHPTLASLVVAGSTFALAALKIQTLIPEISKFYSLKNWSQNCKKVAKPTKTQDSCHD